MPNYLIDNHVHLLIKEGEELGTSFQNRFNSEAVEGDSYLMTVVRFMHCDPIKAGIASRLKNNRRVVIIRSGRSIRERQWHG